MRPQDVFHSITATPGVRDLSFEELRVECYAIAAVASGAPPRPVPPSSGGLPAPVSGPSEFVKVIPPNFAPFVDTAARGEPVCEDNQRDVEMPYDVDDIALSADFTFVAPEELRKGLELSQSIV